MERYEELKKELKNLDPISYEEEIKKLCKNLNI